MKFYELALDFKIHLLQNFCQKQRHFPKIAKSHLGLLKQINLSKIGSKIFFMKIKVYLHRKSKNFIK